MVRKISRMVWLCEFRDYINGWDLKILYRDLENWKKMKWNRIIWRIWKVEKNEKIECNRMSDPNK